MSEAAQTVRIGRMLRHGNGEAVDGCGKGLEIPFTLPGELVEASPSASKEEWQLLHVLEPSPRRIEPGCPHFGLCGGCQLQMASAEEQLRIKQDVLLDRLQRFGMHELPELQMHSAEPWGYRNRIRMRVGRDDKGTLRLGYNERGSRRFLPVHTCPISAALLWRAAKALLASCKDSAEMDAWLSATAEVELFADDKLEKLQLLLLLEGAVPVQPESTFAQAMSTLQKAIPELAGAGALQLGPAPRGRGSTRERARTPVAAWGAAGLSYAVGEERYWITRGGFFQVNRFLLPQLARLVCDGRSGRAAWDLFAGVGLFSRLLARNFEQVTAIEGNPIAARDLQAALSKIGKGHRALQTSTLDFLRAALVQRERPDLLTLDPPRAGAGEKACELLLQLGAPEMVYVSCDPETLARDLALLQAGYRITALYLADMFPQTYHQETVVVLQRKR